MIINNDIATWTDKINERNTRENERGITFKSDDCLFEIQLRLDRTLVGLMWLKEHNNHNTFTVLGNSNFTVLDQKCV